MIWAGIKSFFGASLWELEVACGCIVLIIVGALYADTVVLKSDLAQARAAYAQKVAETKAEADEAALKSSEAARAREAQWQASAASIEEVHQNEVRTIAADRDRALASLRNRPGRPAVSTAPNMPASAASAPDCGSGATLYREDAEFLTREAARADELRAAIQQYLDWLEAMKPEGTP